MKLCGNYKYKGDGNCDDENNNADCEFDGGDCCAKSVEGGQVKTDYCEKCQCLDPKNQPSKDCPGVCGQFKYKGDGNCDDENNNCGCEFDGGDCCAKSAGEVKTDYCEKCQCLDPKNQPSKDCPGVCGQHKYKGDGNCDDDNNNCGCDFDGGDCCGLKVDKTYCKTCACLDPKKAGKKHR